LKRFKNAQAHAAHASSGLHSCKRR